MIEIEILLEVIIMGDIMDLIKILKQLSSLIVSS